MKKIKKIMALAVAVVMCLSMMSVVAFAAEDNVTITVTNSDPADTSTNRRTYNYYKIFHASLVSATDATQGASYYLLSPSEDSQKEKLDALKIDGKDVFSFTKTADGSRWVMSINAKSTDNTNGIDFDSSTDGKANAVKLAEALKTMVDANSTLFPKSDNFDAGVGQTVEQGYYLITSSLGTKMILDTYVTTSITEKNDYPSNTKTDDKETVSYGETVTYEVEVKIPDTVAEKDIVVVDTITKGLTMNTDSGAITVTGTKNGANISALSWTKDSTNPATVDDDNPLVSTTYKTTISALDVKANAGQTIKLTYTATVNADAVVNVAEHNKAHIEYDNFVTKDVDTDVTPHGFTLRKIKGSDATGKTDAEKLELTALDGAEFTLWSAATAGTEIKLVALKADGSIIAPTDTTTTVAKYRVAQSSTEEASAVNVKAGTATIDGLAAGTYYLQEEVAPAGYNKLTERKSVDVSANTSPAGVDIAIENNTGAELPSTGGIGTTIFYVIGAVLVIGAGVLLVTRRRMRG
ncbi:MAG: isopeptide-forming domain-containing fimbrial protein [Anaerovoracaceae bacterium]